MISKILRCIGTPKAFARLGSFLFLSSLSLYLIVFVIAQADSFALFLLLLDSSWIGQEIEPDETANPEEIELFFMNPDYKRNNFCSIEVEVIDTQDGRALFSGRIGCSMIESGEKI